MANKCAIKGCPASRHVSERIQPYTKEKYSFTHLWCASHQSQRDEAANILGLPDFYEDYLSTIPKTKVDVDVDDLKGWYEKHSHPERPYRGAIGGTFTTTSCHTSVGDIRSIMCGICGESASIEDHW